MATALKITTGSLAASIVCLLSLAPDAHAQVAPVTETQVYVDDLFFPVDMVRAPGSKKIFFTEKISGRVRVLKGQTLLDEPCVDLDVNSDREQGATGIALHPDFRENHFLYVYFQSKVHDDNRVVRFTVDHNRCTRREVIFSGIDQATIHNGGQLEFLDGYLFVSTGDAMDPYSAQDPQDLSGKILRLYPNGSVPADNPLSKEFPGSPVWSLGHRNPFGLAVRPGTSQLFESENGPSCADEVNLIEPGSNYGWGVGEPGLERRDYERVYCETNPAQETEPLWSWGEGEDLTIAPTDLAWYRGPLDAAHNRLLMGDFKTGRVHVFELTPEGAPVEEEPPLADVDDAVIDVARGPGGWVYFLTPGAIMRIVEVPAP